jgi:hypothetical protein
MYIRNFVKFFIIKEAHDITIVTLDVIRTMVFAVARGTFRMV